MNIDKSIFLNIVHCISFEFLTMHVINMYNDSLLVLPWWQQWKCFPLWVGWMNFSWIQEYFFFKGGGGLRCSKYSITLLKPYSQSILKDYLWQRKSKQSIRGIIFQDGYPHCCHGTQLWKSTADTQEFYIKGLKPPKNYILLFSIRTHLRELQTRNS